MISGYEFADRALSYTDSHIPYSELDCQAFVERVLSDCGERHNWRGSNHMWRSAVTDRAPIKFIGEIPVGAWLFRLKYDGGEVSRGYNDSEGNAAHVAIYCGCNIDGVPLIMESSTGGVQLTNNLSKFTHYAQCKYITYDTPNTDTVTTTDYDRLLADLQAVLNKYKR